MLHITIVQWVSYTLNIIFLFRILILTICSVLNSETFISLETDMTTETISDTSRLAHSQLFSPYPSSFSSRQVFPGATRQVHPMQRPKEHADFSLSGILLSPPHWQDTSSSSGSTQGFGFSSTSNASSSIGGGLLSGGLSSTECKLLSSSHSIYSDFQH
jgi:hypothetical protein